MTIKINEIFTSIQGEGRFSGIPTMFIRTQGCSLGCDYCDTTYAHREKDGEEISVARIAGMISNNTRADRVCITGGEPLEQKDAIKKLVDKSPKPVSIETNGDHKFNDIDCPCTVDIKMPSANLDNYNYTHHFDARGIDEFKVVIADKQDWQRARAVIQSLRDVGLDNIVWISPAYGQIDPEELANWVIDDEMVSGDIRFQLQIHKYVWPPDERGV